MKYRMREVIVVTTMAVCDASEHERTSETTTRGRKRNEKIHMYIYIYFFLAAFSADLVTLPPDLSVLSTDLMMPTATVCLMSRTAKRPRGGYSL